MADIKETIKALNDWIEEPNAINSEIDGSLVSDAVDCLEEQQAKIKKLNKQLTEFANKMAGLMWENKRLKEQEAMNVDSFVQWCIDSHIVGDATISDIKYLGGKFKEGR